MLKKTRLSLAVGAAFSAGLVGFAPSALGQAAPTTPVSGQQLDRVEITGSLIRRSQAETALPVTSIEAEDLRKAGVTTAEQAMSFIPENQATVNSSRSVGTTNGSASYVDLRGLGASRTLVLLNGQRVVNNPYSGIAVDVNTLPTVAIERIDVLRDGASAIYGTDAIAGVVNVVTRKEYQGISVAAWGASAAAKQQQEFRLQHPRRYRLACHAGLERLRWLHVPKAERTQGDRPRLHRHRHQLQHRRQNQRHIVSG